MPRWLYRLRYIIAGVRILAPWDMASDWTLPQAWRAVRDDYDNGVDAFEWMTDNYSPEDSARESLSYWADG